MLKTRLLKILLITALAVCGVCLLAKSFLSIHTYPEYKGSGVLLMLKLNPLGPNFVCEDTFDADMKSPLRIFWDEMKLVFEDTLTSIFKVPLPAWLFLFLLLLSILLKMRHPALKKWWLAAGVILLPLLVCVAWLFGSHSPGEKVYTSDRRYFYYLEEYNYNDVMRKIIGSFLYRETEYKVFIFDNRDGKRIYTGDAGTKQEWEGWFGFWEEFIETQNGDRVWFYFNKFDYFELPGSQEKHAAFLERQRVRAVRDSIRQQYMRLSAISDSIYLERYSAEARQQLLMWQTAPPISATEVAYLEPGIQKWLDFYGIDLSQARDMSKEILFCFSCPDSQSGNPYYRAFTPQDDFADHIGMFYSPDRRRYIDIGIRYTTENGRRVRDIDAYDSTQQVYLIDRTLKQTKLLSNMGGYGMYEAAFWIDDNTFVLAGYIYDNSYNFYPVSVYNIGNESVRHYRLQMEQHIERSYHKAVVLKEMGIEDPGEDTSGGYGQYSADIGDRKDEPEQMEMDDSIRWEHKRAETRRRFREWQAESPIPTEDVAWLEPVIRPWLDFYGVNLSQALLNEKTTGKCLNCPPDTTSIHYDPFTDDLDTGERIDVDYSPDRQRYVDLGLFGGYYEQDGEYVFVGWDDMHEIHLVDRRQRHRNMILWFGVEGFAEAAFWKSDDLFVVVGYYSAFERFVCVFDIAGRTEICYTIFADTEFGYDQLAYMHNVYWPQKGITIHEEKY